MSLQDKTDGTITALGEPIDCIVKSGATGSGKEFLDDPFKRQNEWE
jgi:hypothetical protein